MRLVGIFRTKKKKKWQKDSSHTLSIDRCLERFFFVVCWQTPTGQKRFFFFRLKKDLHALPRKRSCPAGVLLQTGLERNCSGRARGRAYVTVAAVVDGQLEQRIPERLLVRGRIRVGVRTGLDVPDQVGGHVVGRTRPENGHGLRGLVQVERRRAIDDVRRRRRVQEHRFRVAGYHAHVPEQLGDLEPVACFQIFFVWREGPREHNNCIRGRSRVGAIIFLVLDFFLCFTLYLVIPDSMTFIRSPITFWHYDIIPSVAAIGISPLSPWKFTPH